MNYAIDEDDEFIPVRTRKPRVSVLNTPHKVRDTDLEHQIRWVEDRFHDIAGNTNEHPAIVLLAQRGKFKAAQGTSYRKENLNSLLQKNIISQESGSFKIFDIDELPLSIQESLKTSSLFFIPSEGSVSKRQFLAGRYIGNVSGNAYCHKRISDLLSFTERNGL